MNLTGTTNQTTVTSVAMRSGTLVILLALVHVISDAVTNMLSALLPTLQKQFSLSETVLALLVAALSFSALVTQPLFGAVADRVGHRRIAALGVIFNAILFSLIGIVPNVYILFGLILVGGLGSAALHPAMASMARTAGGSRPELAVGLFSAGGTLGIAVGPIIIMTVLANFGLSVTPWLMIPGILFGILMFLSSPVEESNTVSTSRKFIDLSLIAGPVGLLALTGILSNVAFVTFTSAMPLWLVHSHGVSYDSTLIGWTLSAFSLAAALGGVVGGMISSRLGAKRLIVISSLLALLPLNAIFFLIPGSVSYFVMVVLAGALINAGMPLLIVSAQDLSPKNAATASGMLMGFSAGVAGLIYVGIGRLQEGMGLVPAMSIGYLALIAAGVSAVIVFKSRQPAEIDFTPGKILNCVCSPCIDQNIEAYPYRTYVP
ncbi:MAG TPA: MFS transporter [Anaerolineales bacterium]|nr:MFS transporter [Anaerolineales bacterium]